MSFSVRTQLEKLLIQAFTPTFLDIQDDSSRHASHREGGKGEETHFTIVVVSEVFNGITLLQRHRAVNEVLKELLHSSIHALSLKTYSPIEYEKKQS